MVTQSGAIIEQIKDLRVNGDASAACIAQNNSYSNRSYAVFSQLNSLLTYGMYFDFVYRICLDT